MKNEIQRQNPFGLVRFQHTFPRRSIERFCAGDGLVSVRIKKENEIIRVRPDEKIFCTEHSWHQWAEIGFMKNIEDEFQDSIQVIIDAGGEIKSLDAKRISRFYALWHARSLVRNQVLPGLGKGVRGEQLTQNEKELLEGKRVFFLPNDGKYRASDLNALRIIASVDELSTRLSGRWGVITASFGQFMVPDFWKLTIVPLTPTMLLAYDNDDTCISELQVAELNRRAVYYASKYVFAQNFCQCPL